MQTLVQADKYSHCAAKRGRWRGTQWCGAAYCRSARTGLLASAKRCRGMNPSRGILNGHSCGRVAWSGRASGSHLFVSGARVRAFSLGERSVCSFIHFSIDTLFEGRPPRPIQLGLPIFPGCFCRISPAYKPCPYGA